MQGKQLLVTDKWQVKLQDMEVDLQIEKDTEVIVKNHFTHISAGTEMACLSGLESWFSIPGVPGYTSIGEVIARGDAVDKVKVGDVVFTYSTHSTHFKLDTQERFHGVCVPVPAGLSEDFAAFTHIAAIAFTSIRLANIELGDYVLVTGQGAIGNIAAQLAQLQGAGVIVTDIDNARLELSRKCGIKNRINSSEINLTQAVEKITEGKMVNTLIDASGKSSVVAEAADSVGLNGEIILLGSPRGAYQSDLTGFMRHFHYFPFNHQMKGALEFTLPTHPNDFNKHSIERNAEVIMNLMAEDRLNIAPLYSHKLSPEKAQEAYEGLRDKKNEYIGVVFDWTNY
jgi:2-desacetyl-2-hydroxyethyl bacteriochlorophyllide A dehydrogenase